MEIMLLPRRILVVVTTAAALTVTACTGSSVASTANGGSGGGSVVPDLSKLHWHGCGGELAGLECTNVQVPLNYADPSGRKLSLAIDMAPATAPASQQQGILLVNPGGPGASGLDLAAEVQQGLSPSVAADYDIIGFDTRGVGSSTPQLTCDPTFFDEVRPDYVFTTKAQEQVLIDRARSYASDCEQRFGWLLPYMTTANMARDLNTIREDLGVSKVNYYAFSYGTYLGQVYATMFPGTVRRMVLDSTVDPTGVWWTDNIEQDYAFQARMNAFFAWVAKYNSTYHLGSTAEEVHNAWYKARDELKDHPVAENGTPMIGPAEYDDTFLEGGYLNTLWPGLAQALSSYLLDGQTSDLISQYQQNGTQDENEFAVYNAVQCADVNWPRSWSYWNTQTDDVYATAPFEAWDNAWYNASCAFWPVKGPSSPMKVGSAAGVTDLPGILMLQGTLDPATPYAGAQNAHRFFPTAKMVVVEGGGNHGQSLEDPSNTCVENYLNDYLASGALPTRSGLVNATCPAVPDPTPTSP
jgi:pimeloyl-ACP methyl ester carboxylesterase